MTEQSSSAGHFSGRLPEAFIGYFVGDFVSDFVGDSVDDLGGDFVGDSVGDSVDGFLSYSLSDFFDAALWDIPLRQSQRG